MKISAIRNKPETEVKMSESIESVDPSKKKARKNKRSTLLRTTSDEEESDCDEREKEKLKVKKRFTKAKLLSSPPPITLTLKKTCPADSSAFLGESSTAGAAHDNVSYLSSSDNDLPALVNAAIKCVESDSGSNNEVTPATQQYTSSLLQDYMEKTQLLAQDPAPSSKDKKVKEVVKRKRGRPKKNTSLVLETDSGECFFYFFLVLRSSDSRTLSLGIGFFAQVSKQSFTF